MNIAVVLRIMVPVVLLIWSITPAVAACDNWYAGCNRVAGNPPLCPYSGPSGGFVLYDTNTGEPDTLIIYQGSCTFCTEGCSLCSSFEIRVAYYDCSDHLLIENVYTCCSELQCQCGSPFAGSPTQLPTNSCSDYANSKQKTQAPRTNLRRGGALQHLVRVLGNLGKTSATDIQSTGSVIYPPNSPRRYRLSEPDPATDCTKPRAGSYGGTPLTVGPRIDSGRSSRQDREGYG